jgi:hypothetical protein
MTVYNVASLVDAEKNGQTFFSTWRKSPTQTTTAGNWFDLSMSPGNPVPNYYIGTPTYFVPLKQSTDGGIPHGGDISPQQKFLRMLEAQTALTTAVPLPLWLLDYLGFYPFIDESVTDEQILYTSVAVPRYPLGEGVQMMAVVVAGQTGQLSTFKVKYTNSAGISDRWTPAHTMTVQSVNGTIISGGVYANSRAPFMALQDGDAGVRSVQSIWFDVGDIGLISLVLVKPIARHTIRGIDAPVERDFYMEMSSIPEIKDDAYLNLIALPAGTVAAAPIYGYIKTVWI